MLSQYNKIFKKYPLTIRLVQVGGFYEVLGLDTGKLNQFLNFTITSKSYGKERKRLLMGGFPVHSIDTHLNSLIKFQQRVVVFSQSSNPEDSLRQLDRFVSPGLAPLHSDYNFGPLCSIDMDGNNIEMFFTDLASGDSFVHRFKKDMKVFSEILSVVNPAEVIINGQHLDQETYFGKESFNPYAERELYHSIDSPDLINQAYTTTDPILKDILRFTQSRNILITPLSPTEYKGKNAKQVVESYLNWSLPNSKSADYFFNIKPIMNRSFISSYSQIALDYKVLIPFISKTKTAFGRSELMKRMNNPFVLQQDVVSKQNETSALLSIPKQFSGQVMSILGQHLTGISVFKRNRFQSSLKSGQNRDHSHWISKFTQMHYHLDKLIQVLRSDILKGSEGEKLLMDWSSALIKYKSIYFEEILQYFDQNGDIIDTVQDEELKSISAKLNSVCSKMQAYIFNLDENGIAVRIDNNVSQYLDLKSRSNKTAFNNAFKKLDLRFLTSAKNCKRITSATYEELYVEWKKLNDRLIAIKNEHVKQILESIENNYDDILVFEHIIADIDCARSLALLTLDLPDYVWTKPKFWTSNGHEIIQGLHPLLHQSVASANKEMIPNDSKNLGSITTISGNNMGGKSTYLKTIAIVHILAQIGSFVPCKSFRFNPVDGVYLRMGSSDTLLEGKSTFYNEALEIVDITKKATKNSLVLVDEFGSSTSVGDALVFGSSFIQTMHEVGCQCFVSTHQHALCLDTLKYTGSSHYHFGIDHKLSPGISEKSNGLEVVESIGIKFPPGLKEKRDLINKMVNKQSLELLN